MLMPVYAVFMRLLYLDVEKGSRTSVCTSTMELESLSGSDYYQPYWLPSGLTIPFEIMGPFLSAVHLDGRAYPRTSPPRLQECGRRVLG
ncbi:unnamed protein product [Ascophyllum nodosum]